MVEFLGQFLIFLVLGAILAVFINPWWLALLIAAVLTWGGVLILDGDWL